MKQKIDNKENDFIVGDEFYHIKKNGEILVGNVEKTKGENCISTKHTCSCGKDTYDTYEKAKKAIGLRSGRNKVPYKCEFCGYWHLTTKNGNSKKHKKYDKRERKYKAVFIERDLKEQKKFKKIMKNRPSYDRTIINPNKENKSTNKVRLGDIWDFKGILKEKGE